MAELPPATLEGWYALHQVARIDWRAHAALDARERDTLARDAATLLDSLPEHGEPGWSAAFHLVGGGADIMLIHFRETLDALAEVQTRVRRSGLGPMLDVSYDFASVTEAGLYAATTDAASEAEPRSKEYEAMLEALAAAERESPHVHTRLYPEIPEDMRYVSFYPMSKRRAHGDNWYALPVAERNRMMREHGLSGRRYAGRIFQVITGSLGFNEWEWGVTLFAKDPLEFKRIVTEMRYDEASARYGEFGPFFSGVQMDEEAWVRLIG
jgi:hydrogen peroxide-dependent heme synthase